MSERLDIYWIGKSTCDNPYLIMAFDRNTIKSCFPKTDDAGTEYWGDWKTINGSSLVISIQNGEVKRFDLPKVPTVAEARALLEGE